MSEEQQPRNTISRDTIEFYEHQLAEFKEVTDILRGATKSLLYQTPAKERAEILVSWLEAARYRETQERASRVAAEESRAEAERLLKESEDMRSEMAARLHALRHEAKKQILEVQTTVAKMQAEVEQLEPLVREHMKDAQLS